MALKLSPRLLAAASLVSIGSKVADIGTDHGYIPIYLLENGICKSALAVDLNLKPLEIAYENIKNAGFSDKIKCILSDGFSALSCDVADTFVIAGMGGETIAKIIENCIFAKSNRYTYILQPMSKKEVLRRFLFDNGFEIESELLAFEKDKIYTVFSAKYTGKNTDYTYCDLILGKNCPYESEFWVELLHHEYNRLKKQYSGLKKAGKAVSSDLENAIIEIERRLENAF